ncbi:hypothetical protein [Nocardioides sp.]|uniref:hypothetical protein n=1 Tax=Nocardioides sp. TaxID=35761 RepID=UPI003513CC7A
MSADLSNHPDADEMSVRARLIVAQVALEKRLREMGYRTRCALGHVIHPDDGARCLRCEKREDER